MPKISEQSRYIITIVGTRTANSALKVSPVPNVEIMLARVPYSPASIRVVPTPVIMAIKAAISDSTKNIIAKITIATKAFRQTIANFPKPPINVARIDFAFCSSVALSLRSAIAFAVTGSPSISSF